MSMSKSTPVFPSFQRYFRGRKRLSFHEKLTQEITLLKQRELQEYRAIFSPHLSGVDFSSGTQRHRVFNTEITFWAFLNQLLISQGSCMEAVKKVQTWCIQKGKTAPSSNSSAYCQARKKLSYEFLFEAFKKTAESLEKHSNKNDLWHNRIVKVADGTGLSMPDTEANQEEYPQTKAMAEGCGFPQMNFVGLFNLQNGALLNWAWGNKHSSERALWKELWQNLESKDVFLGDKAYCSYAGISSLLEKQVDSVVSFNPTRNIDWRRGKKLGKSDRIFTWIKPKIKSKILSSQEWKKLPNELKVRVVKIKLYQQGFRTKEITLATTLLDAEEFTAESLAALYQKRWQVELNFRDIKTTLGMDILSAKTPIQVRKEIVMYSICYNLIRALMQDAANETACSLKSISFKGTVQQINQWSALFLGKENSPKRIRYLKTIFYQKLTEKKVPDRPGRNEPRAVKRRPKKAKLLNRKREEMRLKA